MYTAREDENQPTDPIRRLRDVNLRTGMRSEQGGVAPSARRINVR